MCRISEIITVKVEQVKTLPVFDLSLTEILDESRPTFELAQILRNAFR